MNKDKILKVINELVADNEMAFPYNECIEDANLTLYTLLEKTELSNTFDIAGTSSFGDGGDSWLQCTYYSNKLGKTIIWDFDYTYQFESAEDMAERLLATYNEITAFETSLPNLSIAKII